MFKLIMCAHRIPNNSTVTKVNGDKQYKLFSNVIIKDDPIKIISNDGCKFLLSGDSNYIECVSPDKELVWYIDSYELEQLLHNGS